MDLAQEAVELLSQYVRIDTTNPPGDVAAAADWVEGYLRSEGIATTRLGPSPAKPSVVATVGDGDPARALVLHHHTDVVAAPPHRWTADPFGGEVRDGFVWGRGALDMKGFGVLTLLVVADLERRGVRLDRPVRILATADEEVGGGDGARWLAAHHLDEIGGELLLTEGTFGQVSPVTHYPVAVAEKGVSTVKLTASGEPGHASLPTPDNVVVRMGAALARLGSYRSPPAAQHLARRYLTAFPPPVVGLGEGRTLDDLSDDELEEALVRVGGGMRVSTMLRNTFTPTVVGAGVGQNVVPGVCEAFVDCRSLPGVGPDDVLAEVAAAVDDPAIALELVKSGIGTASPADNPLFAALGQAVRAERPEAVVLPFVTSIGTDAKHLRPAGITCLGLIPFELAEAEVARIHGIDERVSVDNLARGLRILTLAVESLCAAK